MHPESMWLLISVDLTDLLHIGQSTAMVAAFLFHGVGLLWLDAVLVGSDTCVEAQSCVTWLWVRINEAGESGTRPGGKVIWSLLFGRALSTC